MIRRWVIVLSGLIVLGLGSLAHASDVSPEKHVNNADQAASICPTTCQKFGCSWSGEWRAAKSTAGGHDQGACDCGIPRTRNIPGGRIRNLEEAKVACNEICELNDDQWNGQWKSVPGGFDVCGCMYVSEYCPTDKPGNRGKDKE